MGVQFFFVQIFTKIAKKNILFGLFFSFFFRIFARWTEGKEFFRPKFFLFFHSKTLQHHEFN